jgi:hypothetical protein
MELLLVCKLPCFLFSLQLFCCCFVLLTRANFVMGLWAVNFARK